MPVNDTGVVVKSAVPLKCSLRPSKCFHSVARAQAQFNSGDMNESLELLHNSVKELKTERARIYIIELGSSIYFGS